MRILMWITAGFAIACGLGIYLGVGLWLCVIAAVAAIFLFAVRRPATNIIAVVLIGVAAGILWTNIYDYVYINNIRQYDGKTVNATAVISDYSFETSYGAAADAKMNINGKTYSLRLYYPVATELNPGDTINGDFHFRMTTDDSLQGGTYHQGDGIFLLVYVAEDAVITAGDSGHISYLGVRLRRSISQMIRDIFPEDTYAFAKALILGDGNDLSYETDTDFKVSGIRHVIAVSGLHVSILMAVVYVFSGRRKFLSGIIGIPLLLLFAAVVGFTPSVVRACIMQALILIAMFFDKEYDSPTALSVAVLVMLLCNPMTIASVSFQLSCGCIVGIFLFYDKINMYLIRMLKAEKGKSRKARFYRGICAGISITVSASIVTIALSAVYFGSVSIVSVVTNLLAMWVIAFVFWGIGLSCMLGMISLSVAKAIAWVVSWPIRYVTMVAKVMASLPFSAVYTCSVYVVVWLVMCYVLLTVFLLLKKKRPVLFLSCISAGLALAIAFSWLKPADINYQVTVFDVGQGQSVLIESDDRYYLVDCGGDTAKIAADTVSHHLLSRGITRLDGIIVTHYDVDHAAAVPLLLTGISTNTLYLPEIEDAGDIKAQLENCGSEICYISQQMEMFFDSSKMTIIPGIETTADDNERSLCILFQREKCDILITGDRTRTGEKELLSQIDLPELELLVVGHHGSKTSTDFALLEATRPKAAVISVGKDNFHGHPAQEVLDKLNLFGCQIWRTDRDGTVTFKG